MYGCMYVCVDLFTLFRDISGENFSLGVSGTWLLKGSVIFCYLSIRVEDGRTLTAWIYELDMEWVARM